MWEQYIIWTLTFKFNQWTKVNLYKLVSFFNYNLKLSALSPSLLPKMRKKLPQKLYIFLLTSLKICILKWLHENPHSFASFYREKSFKWKLKFFNQDKPHLQENFAFVRIFQVIFDVVTGIIDLWRHNDVPLSDFRKKNQGTSFLPKMTL